jgi:acetyl esterase/lipase
VLPYAAIGGESVDPEILSNVIHLYRPHRADGTGALPIIIDIHGGSWQVGSVREDQGFARVMAARGYAVYAIDYRKAPAHRFPAQIDDVRAAITWIHDTAAKYHADATRVALVGRSAGGHLAMLAGYTSAEIPIRAIVNFYGPADLMDFYSDPPSPDPLQVRPMLTALLGGSPTEMPDLYRQASPSTYIRPGLPPTLHIQGRADNVVKARFARETNNQLLARGSRSILLELPWADHSFDFVFFGPGNALAVSLVDAFLVETLQP